MRVWVLIFVMAMWWMPPAAHAQSPDHQRGTWFFSWSGIPFAKLWIDHAESGGTFELTASFKSRGVLRLFKSMKTFSKGHGIYTDSKVQPLWFDYQNHTENKTTRLEFSDAGEMLKREVVPEDNPQHRPPVPPAQIKGSITPADALIAIRQRVQQTRMDGKQSFDALFYEGKRLMRIHATLGTKQHYDVEGMSYSVQGLTLRRSLVAGFTEKEHRRAAEGEPAATLYLDAESLWPIAMEVPVKLGMMKAYWVAE